MRNELHTGAAGKRTRGSGNRVGVKEGGSGGTGCRDPMAPVFGWHRAAGRARGPEPKTEVIRRTGGAENEAAPAGSTNGTGTQTGLKERTAATYSRASYTCTTIGNEVFDGRVRDGIGSGHLFMATEKMLKSRQESGILGKVGPGVLNPNQSSGGAAYRGSSKTAHKKEVIDTNYTIAAVLCFWSDVLRIREAIKPHDRLVPVR